MKAARSIAIDVFLQDNISVADLILCTEIHIPIFTHKVLKAFKNSTALFVKLVKYKYNVYTL